MRFLIKEIEYHFLYLSTTGNALHNGPIYTLGGGSSDPRFDFRDTGTACVPLDPSILATLLLLSVAYHCCGTRLIYLLTVRFVFVFLYLHFCLYQKVKFER